MRKFSHQGTGVDRLALTFPVSSAATWESGEWDAASTTREGGTTVRRHVRLSDGHNVVTLSVADIAGQKWGRVEGNPARFLDPEGCSLAPFDSVPTVAREMLELADETASRTATLDECNITRLDVARDFRGIERPGFYLRALQGVKRPYARTSAVYSDPGLGGAQTLMVGGKQSKVRLYDQHEAYGQEKGAPEGSLRFEVQGRKGWLQRYAGMKTVKQWEDEAAAGFLAERWEWAGMGVEVSAMDRVVEKVRRSELSATEQCTLLGVLLMRASEAPVDMSRKSVAKYDRLIRGLGVVLTPADVAGDGAPFVGRLDFDSGTEVLRAA